MEKELKILVLEDIQSDAELVIYEVKKNKIHFNYKRVETENEFTEALSTYKPDIILSDYNLPHFTGMLALLIRNELTPNIPFILITGSLNETIAVDCMKAGADDYILKDNLTRLGTAIESALKKKEILENKKEAENALIISEAKYQDLYDNAPVMYASIDVETGNIIQCNQTYSIKTGFTKEELIGRNHLTLYHPDSVMIVKNAMVTFIEKGEINNVELEIQRKDGVFITVILSATAIRDDNGKIVSTRAILHDITERKIAEQQLIIAKEKAEESDKLKSAFLANMSHEIRTPMNAIIGFSELQAEPDLAPEDRNKYIKIVVQRSYDLLGIINDILDISKMESGQLSIFEKEGDVSKVFNELYDFFNARNVNLEKKPIELKMNVKLPPDNYYLNTDFSRLKQILINLIGNSYKFTSKGFIEFGCSLINNDTEILYYVKDSGIGIAKEKQSIIFNRFRQVEDGYLTREYGGVGLGLSISKGLIDLMKGKIWIESDLGAGSTFYFTLPYKSTFMPSLNFHKIKTYENWSDKVIMVVEDDEYNAEYIINVLKTTEVKLHIATSGAEATNFIDTIDKIDLILMDIKLPDISGFELTSIIRKKKPNTPIIAQTAFANESDKLKCMNAGCNDFISKPIDQTLLKSLIQKYINISIFSMSKII